MIHAYFSESQMYIKSDKNTREVTSLFNDYKKKNKRFSIHRADDIRDMRNK